MRVPILLLSVATIFAATARGEDDPCRCWPPNEQQIAELETRIAGHPLPLGALERYARYYTGVIDFAGRRFIRGKLVPVGDNDAPGIHIVDGRMSPLKEEGCISVSNANGGPWLWLRCARPGAWTPSDSQIAELEDLVRQKRSQSVSYARHYAGVMQGDRRIISGVFVAEGIGEKPGVYVASEAELPAILDGGCSVIHVTYDLSSKDLTSRCNGPG
jgi:hypothetical protein